MGAALRLDTGSARGGTASFVARGGGGRLAALETNLALRDLEVLAGREGEEFVDALLVLSRRNRVSEGKEEGREREERRTESST